MDLRSLIRAGYYDLGYLEIVGESRLELCRTILTFLLSVFEKVILCDYATDLSKPKKIMEISSDILWEKY